METKQSARIIYNRVFPTRNIIDFAHQPADIPKDISFIKNNFQKDDVQRTLKRNLPRIFHGRDEH